jgi:GrpB-like predicted nucleotidyltransferase (UPF0157 family)
VAGAVTLWRVRSDEEMRQYTVGEPKVHDAPITLADYDPAWPQLFAREEALIRSALGERARLVEHAGSTSVPDLAAKPIIDIVLAVPDSADEPEYLPDLEAAGYVLRIREPDWHEHRMLIRAAELPVQVHVFTAGSPEIERMLALRDRLRSSPEERDRYLAAKRELAARRWRYVQDYADAKTEVIEDIIARGG